jgi:microcystin-dependent protein
MSYTVNFTETNNASKAPIVVADQTRNNQTSVTFVGKNYSGYGPLIAENFLHLLENFASPSAPASPIQGQLWFDNSAGTSQLKVNIDGTASGWQAAGNVRKATSAPAIANSIQGDLWVDTVNQQLSLYTGSNWLLVGPTYSAGSQTGPILETFVDTSNSSNVVQSIFINGNRAIIISNTTFTPKTTIAGFSVVNKGVNLYTDINVKTNSYKIYGSISQADGITDTVNASGFATASSFLRTDDPKGSTTNYKLTVRNAEGITVGTDTGSLSISTDTSSATGTAAFYAKTGNSIEFRVNYQGLGSATVLHIDAAKFVGVNKTNPTQALDVSGVIQTDSKVKISGSSIDSFATAGGIIVVGTSQLQNDTTIQGQLYINWTDALGNVQEGAGILPSADSAYDIGSTTAKFNKIYANNYYGAFNGTFNGTISGSISGTATRLAQALNFTLAGAVNSNVIVTDGSNITSYPTLGVANNTNQTITFNTSLSVDAFNNPTPVGDVQPTDTFLVYRQGSATLNSISRSTLVSGLQVPIGTIVPFAGTTLPTGWLWCDGSEVAVKDYGALNNVIGSTAGYLYKPAAQLQGFNGSTFALPDLRGRFALGLDNMNNGFSVVIDANKDTASAGGGAAGRLGGSVTSQTIGGTGGIYQVTLSKANLPAHTHTLKGDKGTQYYAIRPIAGNPQDGDAGSGQGPAQLAASQAQYLSNSGPVTVDSGQSIGNPVNIMNPYLTVNYIIFTGVV